MRLNYICGILAVILLSFTATESPADDQVRFFGSNGSPVIPPGTFDDSIPTPDEVLGFSLGERPARQAQVLQYFTALEKASKRVRLFTMGSTYEGRPLIYAVISSEKTMARLDEVKEKIRRISEPGSAQGNDLSSLLDESPAVVWLAYSIHGDEISGVDASLAVAYHLVAGLDSLSGKLLNDLIVIIDPMENPDGRERFLAQMESFATAVPHADGQSVQRGGFWPWGRGNHYLFDMNRDWFTQELPESKARIKSIVEWKPQVVVDAHEMGQWDTYLFSPPRHPFTPQISQRTKEWWNIFAADQAKAFDKNGWAYYTREWNEEWYPGYGSSWPLFTGAIGILYEQAGVSGSRVSRHDGTVLTYSESVQHHYVSSLANLQTAAANRRSLLADFHDARANAIETYGGGPAKAFLVRPDGNPDRLEHLAETLTRQGIEVRTSTGSFGINARDYYRKKASRVEFPAGTLIIPTNQPHGYLAQAILSFDLRLPDSFLVEERRELLKNQSTRLYEITGWSLLAAYGLDAYETEATVSVETAEWRRTEKFPTVPGVSPQQGFLFEADDDRSLRAIAMMLESGLTLTASTKELDWEGRRFSRGSIFLPKRANPDNYEEIAGRIARETGITLHAINGGKGLSGPDIGGTELEVLRKPSIALVAGGSTNFTNVGWIWHLLDQKIGLPVSLLDVATLGYADLDVYNVILLAPGYGYAGTIGKPTIEHLRSWIDNGGTLIAMGNAAGFCADSSVNLTSVRPREQVIPKLEEYLKSIDDEIFAEGPTLTDVHPWDQEEEKEKKEPAKEKKEKPGTDELRKIDERGQLFQPRGAILSVDLDKDEWLTYGFGGQAPVMMTTSTVLMAKQPPVRTVARFSRGDDLRISGLLWPEAKDRIAGSAYCTREQRGKGQVILFADQPNFRGFFRGAERMLSNAIILGPGLGTTWTPDW